jgi:hypothetical protein
VADLTAAEAADLGKKVLCGLFRLQHAGTFLFLSAKLQSSDVELIVFVSANLLISVF